ncbi:MAG: CsbD family protein [Bacteroidetes bacterium]|nr:CsbD family protein [Bacteroidota bacterium]
MNDHEETKESWNATKEKLKQQFSMLTDNEIQPEESKTNEMMDRLQVKLGKTKEEIHSVILGTDNNKAV